MIKEKEDKLERSNLRKTMWFFRCFGFNTIAARLRPRRKEGLKKFAELKKMK